MKPVPETEGTGEWDGDVVEVTADERLTGSIRDLDPPEVDAVKALLHRHGDDVFDQVTAQWTLKVLVRPDIEPHRRVFAMHASSLAHLAPYDPVFLGVPLAHLSRKGARLTLEGGRLVAPIATRRRIHLDEKGGQLFLYGRHLFARSIVRVDGGPDEGDEVLVVDADDGTYLGLGIASRPLRSLGVRQGKGLGEREVVVRNRLDLGLYLRAQQEVPE